MRLIRLCLYAFSILAALALAGCGRRGPLEPPPGAAAPAAPPTAKTAGSNVTEGKTHPEETTAPATEKAPRRPFLLDPML